MNDAHSLHYLSVSRSSSNVVHVRQVVQVKTRSGGRYSTVDLINKDGTVRSRDKTTVVKFPDDAITAAAVDRLGRSGATFSG